MNLNDILETCNQQELLKETVSLMPDIAPECLSEKELSEHTISMVSEFLMVAPTYKLSDKYCLKFGCDDLGPYCLIERKVFKYDTDEKTLADFLKGADLYNLYNSDYFSILFIPWSELKGMDCKFGDELNGDFVEYVFPYMFMDIAACNFENPSGNLSDQKVNKLLDIG